MDRQRQTAVKPKDLYVYPLCRQVQQRLQTSEAPAISAALRRSRNGEEGV
jgi:hypothetical protein